MYTAIQSWVNARAAAVNATITGTADDLSEVETGFITKENAESESDKHYQVKIDGWRPRDQERIGGLYEVDVVVEFAFLISNNRDNYGTVITAYLQAFVREVVKAGNAKVTASSFTCYALEGNPVEVEGVNDFEDDHLYPTVSFTLRVGDDNA